MVRWLFSPSTPHLCVALELGLSDDYIYLEGKGIETNIVSLPGRLWTSQNKITFDCTFQRAPRAPGILQVLSNLRSEAAQTLQDPLRLVVPCLAFSLLKSYSIHFTPYHVTTRKKVIWAELSNQAATWSLSVLIMLEIDRCIKKIRGMCQSQHTEQLT